MPLFILKAERNSGTNEKLKYFFDDKKLNPSLKSSKCKEFVSA